MGLVCAFRFYGPKNRTPYATPPLAQLDAMLDECAAELTRQNQRPIACECLSWARPVHVAPARDNAAVSMIMLRTEPGAMAQPLRQWFAWQHPRWVWSMDDLPELPERAPA